MPRQSLLVVTACALTFASCGGTSASTSSAPTTTLSAAEYVERADALCGRLATDVTELNAQSRLQETLGNTDDPDDTKMKEAADLFEDQLTILHDFRADLEVLGTPDANAADVEQLVAKTREAETALEQAVVALREGDQAAATDALEAYTARSQESAEMAQGSELDFRICGSGA